MPNRKPPGRVLAIKGEFEPDIVTDEDYEVAVEAQAAVLRAEAVERKILGRIRSRFVLGASDAGIRWYFDADLGIVRRRQKAKER